MKDLKGLILFIVIAIVAGFIILGALKRQDAFNDINKYVNDNKSELETIKDEYLNGNEVELPEEIESVKVITTDKDTLVYFKMKDRGSKKTNIGFYYSKIDFPNALEEKNIDIVELGGDKYKWVDDSSEGITNKITKNWYSYKKTK